MAVDSARERARRTRMPRACSTSWEQRLCTSAAVVFFTAVKTALPSPDLSPVRAADPTAPGWLRGSATLTALGMMRADLYVAAGGLWS